MVGLDGAFLETPACISASFWLSFANGLLRGVCVSVALLLVAMCLCSTRIARDLLAICCICVIASYG